MTCKEDTSKADTDVITGFLSEFALMLAWCTWVLFVVWLGAASGSMLLFDNWFWPNIGDWLVKAGIPRSFIGVQLLVGWFGLMAFLMLAPAFLWSRFGGKSPTKSTFEDGTWTLNLPHHCCRDGVWIAWLTRESIVNPRFQRARFVLAEGPAVLISAADLRRALADWLANPNGRKIRPVKIDFEHNTVNGVPVEMSAEGQA